MKLRYLLIPSLAGLGLYQVYKNRHKIKATIEQDQEHLQIVKDRLTNIQDNLAIISDQGKHIQNMGQDLTYKLRVFEGESQPLLKDMEQRMSKYQDKDKQD